MPASDKIRDWRDLVYREPYKTILDILENIKKPLKIHDILLILKGSPEKVLNECEIERVKNCNVQDFRNLKRERLHKILNNLEKHDLIHKQKSEKLGVEYIYSENLNTWFPYRVKFMENGTEREVRQPVSEREIIKKLKQKDQSQKKFRERGKYPSTPAFIIEELVQDMCSGFKKTAKLFEIEYSDFEFILEVKHKDKLYYKKIFKS
jgi:hypothetical protein